MSKVVHLSDEAHAIAKSFCKKNGLKMSDWVAGLIEEAVARRKVFFGVDAPAPKAPSPEAAPAPSTANPGNTTTRRLASVPTPAKKVATESRSNNSTQDRAAEELPPNAVPKKKKLVEIDERPEDELDENRTNPWEAPPFWTKQSNG